MNLEDMFADYPDVVSVTQLRKMLDISRNIAYGLVQSGEIKSFMQGSVYKIPKVCVIEYVYKKMEEKE